MGRRTKSGDLGAAASGAELTDDNWSDTQSYSANPGASSGSGDRPSPSESEPQDEGGASGVVESAKQAAGHVVEQFKDQASSRADQQRQTVASGFEAVAQAFRNMGDDLRKQDQGPVAYYAAELGHTLSGKIDQMAGYLHGRDVNQLVNDAEDFARRSPAVFLGSAFALGLIAARFLKSSRPAPDFIRNMPDPNRALPPASVPSPGANPDLGVGL